MTVEYRHGGSIPWMAPERLESDLIPTAATDIWAFGMTVLVCPYDLHLLLTIIWISLGALHSCNSLSSQLKSGECHDKDLARGARSPQRRIHVFSTDRRMVGSLFIMLESGSFITPLYAGHPR